MLNCWNVLNSQHGAGGADVPATELTNGTGHGICSVVWDPDPSQAHGSPSARRRAPDREAFIEDVGRYSEGLGWPRMAGRLVGALMIAEPREQGARDLAEQRSSCTRAADRSA